MGGVDVRDGGAQAASELRFRAVIFDMDGVLIDSEAAYAEQNRLFSDEMGFGLTQREINEQVGQSAQSYWRALKGWFARTGRDYTEDEVRDAYMDWRARHPLDYAALLNPGARETLEGLRGRGARLALASSSPMENIRHVLAVCGLEGFFEVVTSGEQFRESKPDPEIYLHTLASLGLPATACCCVEDSVPGITAGKRAGLYVFAKREERFGFSQDAADHIIDGLPDLLALV